MFSRPFLDQLYIPMRTAAREALRPAAALAESAEVRRTREEATATAARLEAAPGKPAGSA